MKTNLTINRKGKTDFLMQDIKKQIKRKGRAIYDFGVFYVFKRKNGTVATFDKKKRKKVKTYNYISFRPSQALKRMINK